MPTHSVSKQLTPTIGTTWHMFIGITADLVNILNDAHILFL